ncbi:MAG: hypothetical protein HQL37_04415 [Alphaproteobacteria bacterium]|nr:hypothetical protein [Alphaproteobacteria bacterium]
MRVKQTVSRIYPTLQSVEVAAVPMEEQVLAERTFEEAFDDDRCIERGILMFRAGVEAGAIEIRTGPRRNLVRPDQPKRVVGACGMSVSSAERYFLFRAARLIFRNHPTVRFSSKGMLTDISVLPRLRLLGLMRPAALIALQQGLNTRFRELFYPENEIRLQAIGQLQEFHITAINEALGARSSDLAGWSPEMILAIAESFTCAEQLKDIGPELLILKGPTVVRALGNWSIRDVTEKVNEERTRRGGQKLSGQAFETDIGIVRNLLAGDFTILMEQPAELLEAVRLLVVDLRKIEKKTERADRVEEFRLFCKRYLGYMTPDILNALHLLDTEVSDTADKALSISFREVLGILEGLWTKEGVGRAFFEQVLTTPHGVKALRNLVDDVLQMKSRGSIKANTDLAAILSGSDLFDSHIKQFIDKKKTSALM